MQCSSVSVHHRGASPVIDNGSHYNWADLAASFGAATCCCLLQHCTVLNTAVNNIASPPPPWWREELGATLPRCHPADNPILLRGWQSRERWTAGGRVAPAQLSSGRWLVPFSEIFYSPIAAGDHFRSGIGTIFRIMTDNNPIVHTLKIWFGPPIVKYNSVCRSYTRMLTTLPAH